MKLNMYINKLFLMVFFVTFISMAFGEYEEDFSDEEFVPTHEWQRIKEGQAIPPGLHIKVDLDKGGKWAKLNDDLSITKSHGLMPVNNEAKLKQPRQHPTRKNLNEREKVALKYWEETLKEHYPDTDDKSFSYNEIKDVLKNFKKSKEDPTKETQQKFRPIEEIKEDLDALNLNLKTDYEVMTNLQSIYRNPSSSEDDKINALKDLEFYVHQVDNALDFVKMGGLSDAILALNHTSPSLRHEAALVIGSAVQSNPKVQISAIELGALAQLTRMLSDKNEDFKIRKSVLFAISSLIRQFPIAQTFFAKLGGFDTIMQLFNDEDVKMVKLQMKAIRLLTAIMRERNELTKGDVQYKEKLKQYNLLPISSLVEDMHLCEELTKLLESESHEDIQTVLEALTQFKIPCSEQLKQPQNKVKLKTLQKKYNGLATEEVDNADKYFASMETIINALIKNERISDEL